MDATVHEITLNGAPVDPATAYADVGVTWLVDSAWPADDDWLEEFRSRIRDGPAR